VTGYGCAFDYVIIAGHGRQYDEDVFSSGRIHSCRSGARCAASAAAWCLGRGVRRHRHEPDLRLPRVVEGSRGQPVGEDSPRHSFACLLGHRTRRCSEIRRVRAFTVLGSVFLALTGGEALYADMGHFGRRAIRLDWFLLVMPALVLNYLGQGALILAEPSAMSNPFFLLFHDWLLLPLVMLATVATVIASQAVISGARLVSPPCVMGTAPPPNIAVAN
jgi:hypothetical protein